MDRILYPPLGLIQNTSVGEEPPPLGCWAHGGTTSRKRSLCLQLRAGEGSERADQLRIRELGWCVLDPRKKLAYFTKNWDKELQAAALANMEETCYLEMHANNAVQTPALLNQKSQAPDKSGLRELTPDGDEDEPKLAEAHLDPTKPWRDEFQGYLDARESVPEGMTTIEWWGHNYHRYPVWDKIHPICFEPDGSKSFSGAESELDIYIYIASKLVVKTSNFAFSSEIGIEKIGIRKLHPRNGGSAWTEHSPTSIGGPEAIPASKRLCFGHVLSFLSERSA
ncbi:hypothetical protein B0H14DRAFT_3148649 [Mycena olivaceomarginata]|nr:hypothetical protein B0H14DRAFT_3148649 [Mycena olivaceomarginata]